MCFSHAIEIPATWTPWLMVSSTLCKIASPVLCFHFWGSLMQGMGYMYLSPTCIISEFQDLSFCPLRRNCLMSLLVFFTIVHVFALIFVTVTILTHLCVFHYHFVCFVLLFQGHVTCRNCNPTGPLFSLSTSTFQLYSFNLNLQFDDSLHPHICRFSQG